MQSPTPTKFNNYQATDALELTADTWNAVFGDIADRLAKVEVKATGYDEIVNAGVEVAVAKVNDSLTPAVTQITTLIAQANAYLAQLQQTAGGISATLVTTDANHEFVTADQIILINKINTILGQIAALQAAVNAPGNGRTFFLATM